MIARLALVAALVGLAAPASLPAGASYRNAAGRLLRASTPPTHWTHDTRGRETQAGTAGPDQLQGLGGDTLIGGDGDDIYIVWDDAETIVERPDGGIDTLVSGVWGPMTLPANVENLTLTTRGSIFGGGNALDNIIVAGPAGSLLDGYGGDDVLVGGPGPDVFRLDRGNGSDVIVGFTPGTDKLRLQDYPLTSFAAVRAAARDVGPDLVIALGGGETVTLRDVRLADLRATDVQLSIDPTAMTPILREEFDRFTTRDQGGVWITDFGLGKPLYDHGLPGEAQVYVDRHYAGSGTHPLDIDPFAVADGVLSITAAPVTAAAGPYLGGARYTSGVISTNHGFSQLYGYIEMRASLPSGRGFFPAFWMLPQSGDWPPEIDIAEAIGRRPGVVTMTAHDSVDGNHVQSGATTYVDRPMTMHRYGLNWTRETLVWYVDGVEVARQPTPASMRQPFYINVNLAMGGNWAGPPDSTTGTGVMRIDYVRTYANDDTVEATRLGAVTRYAHGAARR